MLFGIGGREVIHKITPVVGVILLREYLVFIPRFRYL